MATYRRVLSNFIIFIEYFVIINTFAYGAPPVNKLGNPEGGAEHVESVIKNIGEHDKVIKAQDLPLNGPVVKPKQAPWSDHQMDHDKRAAVFDTNVNPPVANPADPQAQGLPAQPLPGPGQTLKAAKIAEQPECEKDVEKFCKTSTSTNNFAVLECLQDEVESAHRESQTPPVSSECQHYIWNYKKMLTNDMRFDSAAGDVCKTTFTQLRECDALPRGQGQVIPCLIEHMANITDPNCKQFTKKMASIVFSDYRLVHKFTDSCSADIETQKCGRIPTAVDGLSDHTQGQVVECLSEHVKDLSKACKHQILRIAELQSEDFHLDRPLFYACRDDRERFCERVKAGNGHVYKCLFKHKFERDMSSACRAQLVRRQRLQSEDVKVNKGLFENCRQAIRRHRCLTREDRDDDKAFKMANVIMCLEGAIRDDKKVESECVAELNDMRRAIMEDYRISPDLVSHCQDVIESQCGGGVQKEGKTLHCLMSIAKNEGGQPADAPRLNPECRRELETILAEADVAESVNMDPVLMEACQPVMDSVCKAHKPSDPNMMNCLMENIGKSGMDETCEDRLLEIQYFIARDFKLSDSRLYKFCKKEAKEICSAPENWYEPDNQAPEQGPLVFGCLYRQLHFNGEEGTTKLSRACAFEVRRVMRQRAVSVDLEPRIEVPCMADLAMFCNDQLHKGGEMECLQDHYDDLSDNCKEAVEEFTEDEDKDINLDKILMKACTPMIKEFCSPQLEERETEPEDIMECLIKHKTDADMDKKCAAGIEHHQITNLKDYRFSYKFKEACKKDVLDHCKNVPGGIKKKGDVIKCLSESIRNDTLLDSDHRVSRECRRQMTFELLQRSESINLDPDLKESCAFDVESYCSNVSPGRSAIIECLKKHEKQLSKPCYKKLFEREEQEAVNSKTDFLLVSTCKDMIKTYCRDAQPGELFSCLRRHKDEEDFSQKCKRIVIERMRIRAEDIRLNPLLKKSCALDIKKFCHKEMEELLAGRDQVPGDNPVAPVLTCLRRKFAQKRLSGSCENHIGGLIRESSKDFHQDPRLARSCGQEIETHCSEAVALSEKDPDQGHVEECLKDKLRDGKISKKECVLEIVRVISENKADVQVDPILYRACALDIQHYCADVPRGEGRQMSCLLSGLDDPKVKLKPDCQKMLFDRRTMWEYAAKVAPPDTAAELMQQIVQSPSRNYFVGIIFAIIGCIFIGGLFCGRVTKRVTQQAKNK